MTCTVIPILKCHSAAKEKSSTAAAPLIILQNPTLPRDWLSTVGELMRYTSLSPCWSYRQFPKECLKEACVLHIQQGKYILKGKRPRNRRRREMTETQSTDKNEGSSSDVTTSHWTWNGSRGTREAASSLVTTQLHHWRGDWGMDSNLSWVERENTKDCWRKKSEANCRICTEDSSNKRGQHGFVWSINITLANVKSKLKSLSSSVKSF